MAILTESAEHRRLFWIVVALAFVLRVLWALVVPITPISDSQVYDALAWNISTRGAYAWQNGQMTAYWPVGTAFIYSLPFRAFGHSYAPIAALNVIVGVFTTALLMIVTRPLLSSAAALAAGIIYAVWPSQIEFTSILASELWFNCFVLLGLWASFGLARSWTTKGLVTGVFLAAASYVRPIALPLVLLFALGLVWKGSVARREIVRFCTLAIAAMALCIAPWTLRNLHVLGEPVLISTNGPANTWMGNNPEATGAYMPLPDDVSGMSEVARSRFLGERAKQFVLEHPGRAASLFLRKVVITHDRETIGISWNETSLTRTIGSRGVLIAKAVSTIYWWLALVLGVVGGVILLSQQRWRAFLHPALLLWGYFAFVHAATVGADRYHFPSIPFIAMLGGLAIAKPLCRLMHPSTQSIPSPKADPQLV